MSKQKLKRLLAKLGLRRTVPQPALLGSEGLSVGSYEHQAVELVRLAVDSYSASHLDRPAIDSMTTPNELAFLRAYGHYLFRGVGKVIDLGCWLGATSAALAAGLNENPKASSDDLIEAYDLFQWAEWMNPIREQIGMKANLEPGECFLEIARENLSEYSQRVNLHKQDLTNYVLPGDWKIEFLFVDAMKNWDLAGSIARIFFTRMIPKGAVVVMQDFVFYDPIVATNHLIMWHLRDFFKPLHHVPYSCSVAFLVEKTPALSDLIDYAPERFSEADVAEAYAYCLPFVQESMRPSLLVARLCHHLQCQHQSSAQDSFQALHGVKLTMPMQNTIRNSLAQPYNTPTEEWLAMIPEFNHELSGLTFR